MVPKSKTSFLPSLPRQIYQPAPVPTSGAVQLPLQIRRNGFEMHEVAESASRAFAHFILATTGFPEIGDRREFGVNRISVVPAIVQIRDCLRRVLFFAEFEIDIADLKRGGATTR